MRTLKVGDNMWGFTLLELLMVIGLLGLLSFVMIYAFHTGPREKFDRGEKIIKRLIKLGKRSDKLNNSVSYLMVLKTDRRMICLKMLDDSIYEILPDGIKLKLHNGKEKCIDDEIWEYDELKGKMSLLLSGDERELRIDERR